MFSTRLPMPKHDLTRGQVAQILEDFLTGAGGDWDWDDFTLGTSFDDEYLENVRKRCVGLWKEFPPETDFAGRMDIW